MSRGTAYYDLPNGERIELPTTMPDAEEVPGPLCDGKFELPEAVKEMLCITQHPGVLERPAHWEGGAKQSFDQGMYKADLLLFVKQKDYGPMPKSGKQITLDKKRIYNIKSCSLKAGMYRMELERVR